MQQYTPWLAIKLSEINISKSNSGLAMHELIITSAYTK
jgi:hypothetical protein